MSLIPIRLVSITLPCLLIACGNQAPAGNLPHVAAPSRPDTLATETVPATLDQALDALDRGLSGGDFQAMQLSGEDEAVAFFYRGHRSGRVGWQSPWNLVRDGPLRRELSRSGFQHPDDMSEAVLRSFWRRLHRRPINLPGQARDAHAVREAGRVAQRWAVFPQPEGLLHQCSRQVPVSQGGWIPDDVTIRQLEEVLPAALQDALDRKMPAGSLRLSASDYYRQYGGVIVESATSSGASERSISSIVEVVVPGCETAAGQPA
jgi:hypothetical protein